MGNTKRQERAIRDELWKMQPNCYYCGQLTVLPKKLEIKVGDTCPPNMATLDHVYNRNHPSRGKQKFVLSCNECNSLKGAIENNNGTGVEVDLALCKEETIRKLMIINKMIEFEKEEL